MKVSSVVTTQNEIIELARKVDPTGGWDITHSSTEELERKARELWATGDHSEEVVEKFIWRAFIGLGAGNFPQEEMVNELLGLESIGRKGLEEIILTAIQS